MSAMNPTLSTATLKFQRVAASNSGTTVSEGWIVPGSAAAAFESSYPIGSQHGTYTLLYLAQRDKESIDGDGGTTILYRYSLSYAPPNYKGILGTAPVGDDTRVKSASANAVDIPIDKHPSYVVGWATSKKGVETYISPQPTYTLQRRVQGTDFEWTQSNVIGLVGLRQAPIGLLGGDASKWLCIDNTVRQDGEYVEISTTWQYASNGWDTDIYSSAGA